jgi:hypothetical protein
MVNLYVICNNKCFIRIWKNISILYIGGVVGKGSVKLRQSL